jgi:poly(3-hydroxybutyrate) depolymerase
MLGRSVRTRPTLVIAIVAAVALVGAGTPAASSVVLPGSGPSDACEPGDSPAPVLIALHGYGSSPAVLRRESGLDVAARRAGVALITPAAAAPPSAAPRWSTPGGLKGGSDEADVVRALWAAGEAQCLDLGRISLLGYSNGALMATWLACAWGERVQSVTLVSGANFAPACDPPAVPALLAHGTADRVAPIDGGPVLSGRLRAVAWPDAVARWPGARVMTMRGAGHRWPSARITEFAVSMARR